VRVIEALMTRTERCGHLCRLSDVSLAVLPPTGDQPSEIGSYRMALWE
jgi:hypothetical protein